MVETIYESMLTCPTCKKSWTEDMPKNACKIITLCPHCQSPIKAQAGDCCVYCSYGDVVCPPLQAEKDCC